MNNLTVLYNKRTESILANLYSSQNIEDLKRDVWFALAGHGLL